MSKGKIKIFLDMRLEIFLFMGLFESIFKVYILGKRKLN